MAPSRMRPILGSVAAITLVAALLMPGGAGGRGVRPGAELPLPVDRHGWINETGVTREPSPALEVGTAAVFDGAAGAVLAFGGLGAGGNVSSTTWEFDDGNWEDVTPLLGGTSPPPLYGAALAYDVSDGYALLFGGRTATGTLSNATWSWAYPAQRWTNRTAASAPPPEAGGGMAYDPSTGSVVLDDPSSSLTWSYRAGTWSSEALSPSPGPRSGAVLLTDSALGEALLYGGTRTGSTTPQNDTWAYRDGTWSELALTGAPPAAANATGIDDPLVDGVLLVEWYGGAAETWRFAAGMWAEYAPGGPPPRVGASLVYDGTGDAILCGGAQPGTGALRDDCWAWGILYTPPNPAGAPAPLSLSFEVLLGAVVVVPVAIAVWRARRPRRPAGVRAPAPSPATT